MKEVNPPKIIYHIIQFIKNIKTKKVKKNETGILFTDICISVKAIFKKWASGKEVATIKTGLLLPPQGGRNL